MSKMKEKIEKLLAKAEGTDNPAEAQAFSEAAERLMLKWGIDEAELEAAGEIKPEEIVQRSFLFQSGYAAAMISLGADTAFGFGNLQVLQAGSNSYRMLYIIGHKSDVESYEMLLASLQMQVMSALHSWQRDEAEYRQWMTNWEKFKASRQFIVSFGHAVQQRLILMRAEVRSDASTGAELVLVSKEKRLADYMAEKYPKLGKARGGMMGSHEGRDAGRAAGQRANLGSKAVSNRKGISS